MRTLEDMKGGGGLENGGVAFFLNEEMTFNNRSFFNTVLAWPKILFCFAT